jgi:hypothetical protein
MDGSIYKQELVIDKTNSRIVINNTSSENGYSRHPNQQPAEMNIHYVNWNTDFPVR